MTCQLCVLTYVSKRYELYVSRLRCLLAYFLLPSRAEECRNTHIISSYPASEKRQGSRALQLPDGVIGTGVPKSRVSINQIKATDPSPNTGQKVKRIFVHSKQGQ